MPSRSATSMVDMTSLRVSGRSAGVAIYLREAHSRQSGPPGPDFGWRLPVYAGGGRSPTRGHSPSEEVGPKPPGFSDHEQALADFAADLSEQEKVAGGNQLTGGDVACGDDCVRPRLLVGKGALRPHVLDVRGSRARFRLSYGAPPN